MIAMHPSPTHLYELNEFECVVDCLCTLLCDDIHSDGGIGEYERACTVTDGWSYDILLPICCMHGRTCHLRANSLIDHSHIPVLLVEATISLLSGIKANIRAGVGLGSGPVFGCMCVKLG